jgi:hypothetical protein
LIFSKSYGNDAGEADVETLVSIILGLYSDNSTFVSASLASYNANIEQARKYG